MTNNPVELQDAIERLNEFLSRLDAGEDAPVAADSPLANDIRTILASVSGDMREALEAVHGAMLNGVDGDEGDYGWNITKLNKARPLIRAALSPQQKDLRLPMEPAAK